MLPAPPSRSFIRADEDDAADSWEVRLAKRYYRCVAPQWLPLSRAHFHISSLRGLCGTAAPLSCASLHPAASAGRQPSWLPRLCCLPGLQCAVEGHDVLRPITQSEGAQKHCSHASL